MVHPKFDSEQDKFPQLLILFNDLPVTGAKSKSETGEELSNE